MKKIIALLLALTMLFSFASCGVYLGKPKYALLLDEQEVPAFSNILIKENIIPEEISFTVQNPNYNPEQSISDDNLARIFKTISGIHSLLEVARIEKSDRFIYGYNDFEKNKKCKSEGITYCFNINSQDELPELVEDYVETYYPDYTTKGLFSTSYFSYGFDEPENNNTLNIYSYEANGQCCITFSLLHAEPLN